MKIKTHIKTIAVILAILMLTVPFISCSKRKMVIKHNDSTRSQTEKAEDPEGPLPIDDPDNLIIFSIGDRGYTIIHSPSPSIILSNFVNNINEFMKRYWKITLPVADDGQEEGEFEILVGDTNRKETAQAKEQLGNNDYIITVINEKLVIYAADEQTYKTALTYFQNTIDRGGYFSVPRDLCYRGNKITVFTADEKISGNTQIDISVKPYSNAAKAGIFIGEEYSDGLFGYRGYVLVATQDGLILYQVDKDLTTLASNTSQRFSVNYYTDIRLEMENGVIRGYLLDDAEDVIPWPEFETHAGDCNGYSIGFVELTGYGSNYDNFKITSYDEDRPSPSFYSNTVYEGFTDPIALFHEGTYYLYASGVSDCTVYTSYDLVNWEKGMAVTTSEILGITENFRVCDVQYIGKKFYMAVTGDNSVKIAESDTPDGTFTVIGEKSLDYQSIFASLFEDDDGKVYLYYVSMDNLFPYWMHGVLLDNNMQPIEDTETSIMYINGSWDKNKPSSIESIRMLKYKSTYFLTCSAFYNESGKRVLGYTTSDSPLPDYLDCFNISNLSPILNYNSRIQNTGSHCIIRSSDSGEMLMLHVCYDLLNNDGTPKMCVDPIRFSKYGSYRIEAYGPPAVKSSTKQ